MIQISKRDGSIVPFNKEKIVNAINKAFIEVDGTLYETDTAIDIANDIYNNIAATHTIPTVEEIQNMVEEYLMRSERSDVAREYIRYRYKKEVARKYTNDFIECFFDYEFVNNTLEDKRVAILEISRIIADLDRID